MCIHQPRSLLQKAVLTRPTCHESSAGVEAKVGETGEKVTGIVRARVYGGKESGGAETGR